MYTLENGSEEWVAHKSLEFLGPIRNVFSTCYVAAGDDCKKIFKWSLDTHT